MDTITSSNDDLTGGYATLKSGVLSLISSFEAVLPTLPQAQQTALTLVISQLKSGLNEFETGLAKYTSAVSDSAGYVGGLSDGLSELNSQNETIYGGVTKLTGGLSALAELVSGRNDGAPIYSFASPAAQVKSLQFVLSTGELKPETKTYTPVNGEADKNFLDRFFDLFR
jgi:X-X-X-Leu-X-X-Gly heptad repeat protein